MRYHNITKDDMLNGVAGCSHCCKDCHNPVTWDPNGGLYFDESAKAELFEELKKDYVSGITFSGGDPLHIANVNDVTELSKEIRETFPEKTIWLYTGSTWEEVRRMEIVRYLDVLVDGEFVFAKKDPLLCWKGSSNQRVIDVQRTLAAETDTVPVLHCPDYDEN